MFRQIEKEEVQDVFELILDRIEWMNDNDIHQWNETNYTDAYPLSYYEEKKRTRTAIWLDRRRTDCMCGCLIRRR